MNGWLWKLQLLVSQIWEEDEVYRLMPKELLKQLGCKWFFIVLKHMIDSWFAFKQTHVSSKQERQQNNDNCDKLWQNSMFYCLYLVFTCIKANCHKLLKVLHAFWLFIRSYRIYQISMKLSNFIEHERSLATNKYLFQVDDWDVNAMSMEVVLVALNRYLLSNFSRSVSLFFPIYLSQCFI